jgi:hypothetical protein
MARQGGWRFHWMPEADRQFRDMESEARCIRAGRQRNGEKKSSRQEGLFKQVVKALDYLRTNPRHPGLQAHEFHSIPHPWAAGQKVFVAYVQDRTPGAYRIFWCYEPATDQITIYAIVPHP